MTSGKDQIELEILPLIHQQQEDHGLKHGYYHSYRKYCANHLKKLRSKVKTWVREQEKIKEKAAYEEEQDRKIQEALNAMDDEEENKTKPEQEEKKETKEEENICLKRNKTQAYKKRIDKLRKVKDNKKYERHAFKGYTIDDEYAKHDRTFVDIVLWETERAWAYGMQLKRDIGERKPRAKYYAKQKFNKAVQKSCRLLELLELVGDDRAKLEGNAYFSYMSGLYQLEVEDYRGALDFFKTARTIYEKLGQVGTLKKKEIYRRKSHDINDTYLSLCRHKLRISQEEDDAVVLDLDDQIQDVLDRVKEKEGDGDVLSTFASIEWLGQSIAINEEKTRVRLSTIHNLKFNVIPATKNLESRMKAYDKLLTLYNNMLQQISQNLIAGSKNVTEEDMEHIRSFHSFITFMSLETVIERNQAMIDSYISINRPGQQKRSADHVLTIRSDDKQVNARDMIRLYDVIVQNLQKMEDLPTISDNALMVAYLKKRASLFKVYKIYYLSREYAEKHDWAKADSLLLFSEDCINAFESLPSKVPQNTKLIQFQSENQLDELLSVARDAVRSDRCSIHANAVIEQNSSSKKTVSVESRNLPVLDDLNHFQLVKKGNPHLIAFPPQFESISCKPMFFDLAGNHFDTYPDVSDRKKKAGLFGLW
mmetsp:Transcript_405/g.744  ORF Transcript_405/g.744 Transcript_405/m.744 type:complete len:650 (+) Transcript_405:87-2036(+)